MGVVRACRGVRLMSPFLFDGIPPPLFCFVGAQAQVRGQPREAGRGRAAGAWGPRAVQALWAAVRVGPAQHVVQAGV